MDWKDLEIGNIPSDFFVNERYEVELKNGKYAKKTEHIPFESTVYTRLEIIESLLNGTFYFRYRLKPLKSIRIDKPTHDFILNQLQDEEVEIKPPNSCWNQDKIEYLYNRKVEIIGDDE